MSAHAARARAGQPAREEGGEGGGAPRGTTHRHGALDARDDSARLGDVAAERRERPPDAGEGAREGAREGTGSPGRLGALLAAAMEALADRDRDLRTAAEYGAYLAAQLRAASAPSAPSLSPGTGGTDGPADAASPAPAGTPRARHARHARPPSPRRLRAAQRAASDAGSVRDLSSALLDGCAFDPAVRVRGAAGEREDPEGAAWWAASEARGADRDAGDAHAARAPHEAREACEARDAAELRATRAEERAGWAERRAAEAEEALASLRSADQSRRRSTASLSRDLAAARADADAWAERARAAEEGWAKSRAAAAERERGAWGGDGQGKARGKGWWPGRGTLDAEREADAGAPGPQSNTAERGAQAGDGSVDPVTTLASGEQTPAACPACECDDLRARLAAAEDESSRLRDALAARDHPALEGPAEAEGWPGAWTPGTPGARSVAEEIEAAERARPTPPPPSRRPRRPLLSTMHWVLRLLANCALLCWLWPLALAHAALALAVPGWAPLRYIDVFAITRDGEEVDAPSRQRRATVRDPPHSAPASPPPARSRLASHPAPLPASAARPPSPTFAWKPQDHSRSTSFEFGFLGDVPGSQSQASGLGLSSPAARGTSEGDVGRWASVERALVMQG